MVVINSTNSAVCHASFWPALRSLRPHRPWYWWDLLPYVPGMHQQCIHMHHMQHFYTCLSIFGVHAKQPFFCTWYKLLPLYIPMSTLEPKVGMVLLKFCILGCRPWGWGWWTCACAGPEKRRGFACRTMTAMTRMMAGLYMWMVLNYGSIF